MAIPPEPLAELVHQATAIVVARVSEIVRTGVRPKQPERIHPSDRDIGIKTAPQTVRLTILRTLKGEPATERVVDKPVSAYSLRVGDEGPFFLAGETIIGRYGPNTH